MDSEPRESLKTNLSCEVMKIVICDIGKFKFCKNDEDRVKFMLKNNDEFLREAGECAYEKKSLKESEKFRHSGNLLFNSSSPDLQEVLKHYSKSVLYAPPGSEQLSLAYANRSAVLLRGSYYEECLEDISRALKTGYPDSLKPKLLIRRATCNYALTGNLDFETDEGLIEARALIKKLPTTHKMRKMVEDTLNNPETITSIERRMKKTRPKYQPEMKGRNPHLPGASDAIALRYSEEFGRHLVATRDISSGEVLLIERSYITTVPNEWIYCICSHCAKGTWNGIPCDHCIYAMFCSAECKRAAWEEYHDMECEILGIAKNIEPDHDMLISLRMTMKAIKAAGSVEALRKRLKELDSVKASDVDIPIDSNSYETFYIMSDNPESQNQNDSAFCSLFAVTLAYHLAKKTNLFEEGLMGNPHIVEGSEQLLLFTAGLMLKNTRIALNRTIGPQKHVENKKNITEIEIVMLLPVFSFLNNRCYDAAALRRFGEDMILITPVPIGKGEQIFTCYGKNYQQAPTDMRRKFLKDEWQFVCNCLACTENWSHSAPTIWHDQSGSDMWAMLDMLKIIKEFELVKSEEIKDPVKMIPIKDRICKSIDFMYPRVKKPCGRIEQYVTIWNRIHIYLSSTAYSQFIDKL